MSDAAKELVASMLAVDADDRMTVDEALAHRWIAERDVYAPKIHLQVKSAMIFALHYTSTTETARRPTTGTDDQDSH